MANALRFHPRLGADPVGEAIQELFEVQIRLGPLSADSVAAAVRAAYRTGLTVYDAVYLTLAEHLDCVLYTADERQLAADPTRARHIREFEG